MADDPNKSDFLTERGKGLFAFICILLFVGMMFSGFVFDWLRGR